VSGALSFESATVGYGDRVIVRGAELAVDAGSFIGLVGPNGAGKSTLLRTVTGGADLLGGAVSLGGKPLAALDPRERAQLVGVVPQSLPTLPGFTARAFVEMGRHPHLGRLQALGARDDAIVKRALEVTDTARLAAELVTELSGGDVQRLVLAQALAQEPRVLLLDEPVSHLDLNHRLQVLDLVRSLVGDGLAVLAVFHDLDLAARYSDAIAVVSGGALLAPLPPAEALAPEVLAAVFDVHAVVRTDPVTGTPAITPVARRAELEAPSLGSVGVVGGSGAGAALMRTLALAGFRLHCGALNAGDLDAAVASALDATFAELPPFAEIDADAEAAARAGFAAMDAVVVSATPFGRANLGNLRAALHAERPLVLIGQWDDARDYADGEATALVSEMLARGAVVVQDERQAAEAVRAIIGKDADA
jgi:iron complex transport system ATP-binding protein